MLLGQRRATYDIHVPAVLAEAVTVRERPSCLRAFAEPVRDREQLSAHLFISYTHLTQPTSSQGLLQGIIPAPRRTRGLNVVFCSPKGRDPERSLDVSPG